MYYFCFFLSDKVVPIARDKAPNNGNELSTPVLGNLFVVFSIVVSVGLLSTSGLLSTVGVLFSGLTTSNLGLTTTVIVLRAEAPWLSVTL